MFRPTFFGLLMVLTVLPLGAGERISMHVSPALSFAPARLIVRTKIEANADNRVVKVQADSMDFYRSSEIQLDGERAPLTTMFEFPDLPPGQYTIVATLIDASGRQAGYTRDQVNVMGPGGQ